MTQIPIIKKNDFSLWKLPSLVRGYRQAVKRINSGQISQDRTFLIYDKAENFWGYSASDIVMSVSNDDAMRIAPLLMKLEDRRFYQHHGVDYYSVARAIYRNIQARRIVQGGSTLSMQLIRNTLIETSRTFLRKIVEMALAPKLERKFSKQEIIRLYCEQVFMGKHLRGLQSAAFFIYSKPIAKLSDEEICGLLGMLRSPQKFNPYQSQEAFYNRQKIICQVLKGTPKSNSQINLVPINMRACPHIARAIQKEPFNVINDKNANIKKIGTFLDSDIQKKIDSFIGNKSKETDSAISTIVIDNKTGTIVSETSWNAGRKTDFSTAIEGIIRPGSTYKTFALIAALEQGCDLDMKLLSAPFRERVQRGKNTIWRVRNQDGVYHGKISLKDALVVSDNTVFARLTMMLEHEKLFSVYRRFGLLGNSIPYPSIVHGGIYSGIRPINLATAYQAIANNGVMYTGNSPLIRYIESENGQLFWNAEDKINEKIVLDYEHVQPIQDALQAAASSYGWPNLKSKTGTTKQGEVLVTTSEKLTYLICYSEKGKIIYNKSTLSSPSIMERLLDFTKN